MPDGIIRVRCDHRCDEDTARIFDLIKDAGAGLDLLVNCAWGGYERMMEGGRFTWGVPFWQQPAHRWEGMMDSGVRAAFFASARAAEIMTVQKRGLIVNLSFWPAQKYIGNTVYGMAKAATDKMTADMAHELSTFGVTALSLYPGLVRTEAVMAAAEWMDLSNSESPEFIGRVIAALWAEPFIARRSGGVVVAAQAALELEVIDVDGKRPRPLTLDHV